MHAANEIPFLSMHHSTMADSAGGSDFPLTKNAPLLFWSDAGACCNTLAQCTIQIILTVFNVFFINITTK